MLKKRLRIEAIERSWKIWRYFKIPSTLIISDSCKWIGSEAFCDCRKLKKVIIPESVESIGSGAFYGCINATVILEKPQKEFKLLGSRAFFECKSVEYAEEEVGD